MSVFFEAEIRAIPKVQGVKNYGGKTEKGEK